MPGAAYAVRVYNRLLSDAEQTRNHFVDLCYAFGVDVTGLTLVKEEDLAALCARYGSLTFRDSVRKAEIQQAVDALVRPAAEEQLLAFLGFSTNRSGEEKTLRAVFALEEDALALLARNGEVTLTVLAAPAGEGLDRPEELTEGLFENYLYSAGVPDPELIIRPSGEMRTSNFLLWQSAYSEYVFMDVLWPDFGPEDLDKAIAEYHRRNRRFGGV